MAKKRKLVEVKSDLPPIWGGEGPDGTRVDPEVGETISGIYIGKKRLKARGGRKSFMTFRIQKEEAYDAGSEDGIISTSGSVIERMLSRMTPGTYVEIEFLGRTLPTSNGMAKNFRVSHEEDAVLKPELLDDDEDPGDEDEDEDEDPAEARAKARKATQAAKGKAARAVRSA